METLAEALEREHHEIDEGIETYRAGLGAGEVRAEPMRRAMTALRRHIWLEEQFLFPPLRDAGLMAPVFVMIREHGAMWRLLDSLEAPLAAGDTGPDVVQACADLMAQLGAHNPKEEQILYPQADSVLDAEAGGELRAYLDGGVMPEDWVCEGAG